MGNTKIDDILSAPSEQDSEKSIDKAIEADTTSDTVIESESKDLSKEIPSSGKKRGSKPKKVEEQMELKEDEKVETVEKLETTAQETPETPETPEAIKPAVETESADTIPQFEPFFFKLPRPVMIYRGPSKSLSGRCFGGTVKVLAPTDELGFTKVSFVRSGFGKVTGYVNLPKGVMPKCKQ